MIYRLGAVSSVAVTSTATASVALAGTQTRAVRVVALSGASAVAQDNVGVFIGITSPVAAGAVTSATGTFIRAGTPEVFKSNPGTNTMVEARGIGATAFTLYVTELTD